MATVAVGALLLGTALPAEDEPPAEAPTGAQMRSTELVYRSVDLVYAGAKSSGASADLAGKVEDLKIKESPTEVRIELSGDILFDFDKATLRPEAIPVLERVAEVIRKYGKPTVRIEGHTDSKGNHDYNVKLSQRRAER